ncbi:VIT domain-containing protein [Enhygromyxa salina]|nr:VIT domain-containing protein [Enhygromyxa salina]
MSEHERPDPHDDAVLDANIERLLNHVQRPPAVPAETRARMLAQLRSAQAAASEPVTKGSARADVDDPIPLARAKLKRRRIGGATIFVALAAAVLLAWVLGLGQKLLDHGEAQLIATYENHGLEPREVMLADGSRALLRRGTELVELAPRHLRLVEGEVLLDVRTAPNPLLVETAQGRASVLGTRVLLRSDAIQTLAAVLHGQANLQSLDGAGDLLLRAGEQALLRSETEPARIAGRRLSFEIDWARELLTPEAGVVPVRRGNLLARVPRWTGQTHRSPEWPLPVRELSVDVHVEDGHVRTTIDQTFFNHLERDLEGVYQFPLPPKAAISRLAMYVDGERIEAGVVQRERGRDIYEQIVHRRRDPALLEWMQGNLFQIRIFPLPARTEKRVLLSYTVALEELYGEGELRVPIPELDLPVGAVNYRIRVVGGAGRPFSSRHHEFELREEGQDLIAQFTASDHAIGADIVANLAAGGPGLPPPRIERHELRHADGRQHLGLRLRPQLRSIEQAEQATAAPARDWVVLFDTSASRGPNELEAQRQFLLALLDHLDGDDRLSVLGFDSQLQWASAELERVGSLDRAALEAFLARNTKVGLGATDLSAALNAGLERLAAVKAPADDKRARVPTILYLGDGLGQPLGGSAGAAMVDAAAHVDALAGTLSGAASFVGVSFGPTYDAPALERLAAAGSGLHVHVDEGESVSWRALELLTTLATARVLGLEATLVDAQGQVIAAERTHASARSLAEGESLELLAELAAHDPEPVAVELRGRVGEAAWSERVALPKRDHANEDQAGWLPRAWAQAHVAALTEAGVEQHAAQITELGLAHFLVTPTTSLLVLESEQMYRDFNVHRPSEQAWAYYPAPDKIEVVREGRRSEAGQGQYVVRTPVQMLVGDGASAPVNWAGPMATTPLANSMGFGLGNRRSLGDRRSLGMVGTGRGGGGGGFGFGLTGEAPRGGVDTGAGFGGRGTRITSGPVGLENPDLRSLFGGFVSGGTNPSQWSTTGANLQQDAVSLGAGSAAADSRFASTVVTGALSLGYDGQWARTQPWPQSRHYTSDPRLNDLGELVPALFEEPFDLARERLLLTGLDGARGHVSDPAAELITAARQAQANVRYQLPEGGTLDIDANGNFAVVSERWGFLDERVIYDGVQLRADYPELGLSVARAVGPTSPALFGEWIPWMIPSAEHLAYFYTVERSAPLKLQLRPLESESMPGSGPESESAPTWLEVELDAQHRVIALRVHAGEHVTSTTTFEWTDAGVLLRLGDDGRERERELKRVGPAQTIASLGAPQATEVNLPLPSPADLERALEAHQPGDAAWIDLQHQRLAGYAALNDEPNELRVLQALRDHAGRVLPGELVLAGASLRSADAKQRKATLDAANDGPITAYIAAGVQGRSGAGALRKLARDEDLRRTPVGFMASYRALLFEAEGRPNEASLRQLEAFLRDYQHPTHAYVATLQLSHRWWSHSARKSAAWSALATQDNRFKYIALHQAALTQYQAGHYDEAGLLFQRNFEAAQADHTIPLIDWSVQWAMTQALGEAGWQLTWTRLRERVIDSGDPRLAIELLNSAQQLGRVEDVQRVIASLDPTKLDPVPALALFDALIARGHVGEAGSVLRTVLAVEPINESAPVLLRASMFAERQGHLDEAATQLERAMLVMLDEGLSLADLRAGFARLLELRGRLAQPLSGDASARAEALDAALAVADRWRLEDPDNPQIDLQCAQLLWTLGHDQAAWRHLSSSLDRHAAEGDALAWIADALERGGDLTRADQVWARAIAVEPTDPTHRLRRAQNLLATGDDGPAKALLHEIETGDWQPRFAQTINQAKRLTKLVGN